MAASLPIAGDDYYRKNYTPGYVIALFLGALASVIPAFAGIPSILAEPAKALFALTLVTALAALLREAYH